MRETRRMRGHKHIGFEALARKVEMEYIRKGYPRAEARRIGIETAGKVWARQHVLGRHPKHPVY
ncbi:MAG: hypothetical protein QXI42_12525 [Thermoproteota archaeon]